MKTEPTRPNWTKTSIVRAALDLGAVRIRGASLKEEALLERALSYPPTSSAVLTSLQEDIRHFRDPLGEAWISLRSPKQRRKTGAFYTEIQIVRAMVEWLLSCGATRIVDAGCGSGRFALQAASMDPTLSILAVDVDPVATVITRANLAVVGARRATVQNGDFLECELPSHRGVTAFASNPPYVRHHELPQTMKARGAKMAQALNHVFSRRAGLHAYFFMATALKAKHGDVGCFITSAEWLENSYGRTVRDLLMNGLGGQSVRVVDPRVFAFERVMTTAAITCFRAGTESGGLRMARVASTDELRQLDAVEDMPFYDAAFLATCEDWKPASCAATNGTGAGLPTLGQVFRVSRGTATGANSFFVLTKAEVEEYGLSDWCVPVLCSARRLPKGEGVLRKRHLAKYLLVLPESLDRRKHRAVDAYLKRGEVPNKIEGTEALCERNLTSARDPWWSIEPATPPIIVSYMARSSPRFYLNPNRIPVLNIAHGLYPIKPMAATELGAAVHLLNAAADTFVGWARTYHGDLKKFEPRDLERIPLMGELVQLFRPG